MNNKIIIAIDAMGGENAPNKNIHGLSIFINKNKKNDFFFHLYGDEDLINKSITKYKIKSSNIHYKFTHGHETSDQNDYT